MAGLDDFAVKNGEQLWADASKPDPLPGLRAEVIRGIIKAIGRLDKPRPSKNDWFTKLGDLATLQVRFGDTPINFYNGTAGMIVKQENAQPAYEAIMKLVQEGKLDAEIQAAAGGAVVAEPKSRRGGAGKSRGPMSQETKDKIAAARRGISVEEFHKLKA